MIKLVHLCKDIIFFHSSVKFHLEAFPFSKWKVCAIFQLEMKMKLSYETFRWISKITLKRLLNETSNNGNHFTATHRPFFEEFKWKQSRRQLSLDYLLPSRCPPHHLRRSSSPKLFFPLGWKLFLDSFQITISGSWNGWMDRIYFLLESLFTR